LKEVAKKFFSSDKWEQLERGEIDEKQFVTSFQQQLQDAEVDFAAQSFIDVILSLRIRGNMIDTIHTLKRNGYRVVALTNNWIRDFDNQQDQHPLGDLFDEVFESCKLKMRKPERRIYEFLLSELNLPGSKVVFLDDLKQNLDSAAHLGIHTIQVKPTDNGAYQAINQLNNLLGQCLIRKPMEWNVTWEFCSKWLPAWTGNQPELLASFYADDAIYCDPSFPRGLIGKKQILRYFRRLLKLNEDWKWRADEVSPCPGGFGLKWVATLANGTTFWGSDIVQVDDQMKITRNEVYFDPKPLLSKM